MGGKEASIQPQFRKEVYMVCIALFKALLEIRGRVVKLTDNQILILRLSRFFEFLRIISIETVLGYVLRPKQTTYYVVNKEERILFSSIYLEFSALEQQMLDREHVFMSF